MQNVELKELQLLSKWKSYLTKAGYLTAAEVLLTTPAILAKRTKLPPTDIAELLLDLSIAASSTPLASTHTVADLAGARRRPTEGTEAGSEPVPSAEVELEKERRTITLGDEGLDSLLGDGIQLGSVTEVAGQSASGKSHFCLQLALHAQLLPALGGVSGGTILISSEGIVPSSRLLGLARTLVDTLPVELQHFTPWDYLDNVHTEKAQDVETLDSLLAFLVPAQIERLHQAFVDEQIPGSPPEGTPAIPGGRSGPRRPPLPIRLVIVDSIAAPFRAAHENDSGGFVARAKELGSVGDQLKRLAYVFDCAVVVVNQVSDVFDGPRPAPRPPPPPPPARTSSPFPHHARDTGHSTTYSSSPIPPRNKPAHEQYHLPSLLYSRYQVPHFSGQTPSLRAQAALGYSWTNMINTRLMLSRTKRRVVDVEEGAQGEDEAMMLVRRMSVVFSPVAPRGSIEYVIVESGLRSLGEPRVREPRWAGLMDGEAERNGDGRDEDDESFLWSQMGSPIAVELGDLDVTGEGVEEGV